MIEPLNPHLRFSNIIILRNLLFLLGISFSLLQTSCTDKSKKHDLQRKQKAWALYQQRCKISGEKIYQTIDNVDGLLLIKVRPDEINFSEQFLLSDPYGRDLGGDGYLESFLYGRSNNGQIDNKSIHGGFNYIDTVDPKNGVTYRYTGYIDQPWLRDKKYGEWVREFTLTKTIAPNEPVPRYGITYDDISTREDRELWIAGSSLRVIDLQTNVVVAERIGYMIDIDQGNISGGRSPWLLATRNACPAYPDIYQTRNFVEKVLKPAQ
ncbi:hypothetical protein HZU75_06570 [Chitinibacter fontanus]|uniref:Uncharacterized protein n=1 Tax=Chitinibacter fontanus TaxID=1737446 RepID=A0A7D5Z6B6_9NEIS|nr:hypothetical protein [Chitinibacter fontanus]QLI81222.1 hypothetical protein HZU75_06570 [Chitinibacter fontanus]